MTSHLFRNLMTASLLLVSTVLLASPKIETWTTPEGTKVFFVETHDLPMIDLRLDFAAGAAFDPQGKSGVASFAAALLDAGTPQMDEEKIANAWADLGAQFSASTDKDRASVSLRTLSDPAKKEAAFALFQTLLASPSYPDKALAREKKRAMASLKEALTKPEVIASRAFSNAIYQDHPYGRQTSEKSLSSLTQQDVKQFHQTHYSAKNASLAIVGDLSLEEARALSDRLTRSLPQPKRALEKIRPVLAQTGKEVRIPHSASQAHMVIGQTALKRGDPDFFPLIVGNYVLGGGGFVSRLMHEVREKRGLVYGISSGFSPLLENGVFQINLQTKKEQKEEALTLVRSIVATFLKEGITDAELQAAKDNLAGSFPLRLDGNGKMLANLANMGFYGLPLDYLDRYQENIRKVSKEEVLAAFTRHLSIEAMATVIVGD